MFKLKKVGVKLFTLLLLNLCFLYSNPVHGQQEHPNIIIFLVDDLGYGDIQAYGSPYIRTPNIDSLASTGIRFTSYEAAPWCVPSRAEWMTGIYAPRIHFNGGTGAGGHGGIPDSILTLAQGLKQAGYATGMAGKWHLGYDPKRYLPTNKGFDSWLGLPYSNDYKKPYVQTDVPLVMYRDTTVVESPVNQDSMTIKYTAEAKRFIRAHAHKQPIFFYFAYNMVHLPLHTTKEFLGKSGAGLLGDVMGAVDWSVGQVLQVLKEEGLAENTIVIFASDNGPWNAAPERMFRKPKEPEGSNNALWYRGNKPWDAGTTGPLRGYKHTTYEGGTRVPAIISWPGHIQAAQVSNALVTNMDMFRTLLEIGGGELPKYQLDGYNMMPFFTGKTKQNPRSQYAYIYHKIEGIRVDDWVLRIGEDGEFKLFNIVEDVGQNYNRAKEKPEMVKKMKTEMDSLAQAIGVDMAKKAHNDAPSHVGRGEGRKGFYQ